LPVLALTPLYAFAEKLKSPHFALLKTWEKNVFGNVFQNIQSSERRTTSFELSGNLIGIRVLLLPLGRSTFSFERTPRSGGGILETKRADQVAG